MTTLILSAHPDPARSQANEALLAAAGDATVVRLAQLYPDGAIDDGAEAARVLAHDALVLQFPMQWYAMPSLLKDWLDAVLTRMVYIHGETEGQRLRGRTLMVAVTCGAPESAYMAGGRNGFTVAQLLRPLQATALRCGMHWAEPYVVYDARDAQPAALDEAAARYADRLAALSASAVAA